MLETKNPSCLINKPEDWDSYLNKQLERLQTNCVDFYLQHALNRHGWKYKKLGLWEKPWRQKGPYLLPDLIRLSGH